ncbi:hypothetical protein WJX79_002917 [Trebouxia sp. C0005]
MIFSSPEELLRVLPEHAKSSSTTARKDISPDRRPQDCASDEASSLPLRHQESPIDVDQHQALQTGPLLSRPGSRTGMTAAVSARQLLSRAHAKTALVPAVVQPADPVDWPMFGPRVQVLVTFMPIFASCSVRLGQTCGCPGCHEGNKTQGWWYNPHWVNGSLVNQLLKCKRCRKKVNLNAVVAATYEAIAQ